eukprot:CAMPEP_0179211062 /NCGR_PEP_ID=MMETSP0797-20121207/181_1 /TAXON_ID=47934 /ORGANISM="Dinophysis acuminata, Strain DAEP01" /LENGTH=97 /DNA_ID=CAMNT_0020916201 /DNA_START=895 /DNA_END=1188 /DNA_ORIENTATION=-
MAVLTFGTSFLMSSLKEEPRVFGICVKNKPLSPAIECLAAGLVALPACGRRVGLDSPDGTAGLVVLPVGDCRVGLDSPDGTTGLIVLPSNEACAELN